MDSLTSLLRRFVEFLKGLFTPDTTTAAAHIASTSGDLGPLGQFVLALVCSETARNAWITNRAEAIANSGLSAADQQLLTAGDSTAIVSQIVQESGGTGSRLWICVWIR